MSDPGDELRGRSLHLQYRVTCPICERTIGAIHIVRGDGTALRVRTHKRSLGDRKVLCEGRLEHVGWDAIVHEPTP